VIHSWNSFWGKGTKEVKAPGLGQDGCDLAWDKMIANVSAASSDAMGMNLGSSHYVALMGPIKFRREFLRARR
jgi:hypothetical protein